MHQILTAGPLAAEAAHEAYPLVSLVAPGVSERRWRTFAGEWLAAPRCRAGITTVRNRAQIYLAAYAWQVRDQLDAARRSLRVAHLFVAGLPGRSLGDYVLATIEAEAKRRRCGAVVIEQSDRDFATTTRLPDACLRDAGFVHCGDMMMRPAQP